MELWTIQELARLVDEAIREMQLPASASARVRDVPDQRTIRYYTTLGLLDRPAEMRGRTAYYGKKHLVQLLCIKRFQAEGCPLAEIQQRFSAADEKTMIQWAGLPDSFEKDWLPQLIQNNHQSPNSKPSAPRPRADFWQAEVSAEPQPPAPQPPAPASTYAPQAATWVAVAPGITLLVQTPAAAQLDPAAWARLQPAIQQLAQAIHIEIEKSHG